MEIKISIEKKYVWLLILTLVAVGFVVAYGGTNPQQMGHNLGEVQGAAPNCLEMPQSWYCQQVDNKIWGHRDVAVVAAMAWDSLRLGTVAADQFCRKDGTNCPATSQLPSGLVYKRAATEYCGGTAFFCDAAGKYTRLQWYTNQFFVNGKFVSGWGTIPTVGAPVPFLCGWVLCTQ